MTVLDVSVADEELEARIKRAVRSYHRRGEVIVRADFAATVSHALLQMRPPKDAGERAAGISEGLEMAVRTLLRLAGVDTPDNPEEAPRG
ncbi:hypothetical protein Sme01_03850 [Sphaerisporangium melleum]|uniref:Uncharacterized protein n=1 Tax=Sphaerisporangium melleum TaxID=321316 RepID=A0A917QQE4_9ACTN|nr:hypothetical protein [Sphaerisporangium melleum]GGK61961.1 hypothetical protein GCM10007964_01400 [Sphaerisporangium melleum]GII67909.1 hypothetical protein Sme01_03850 [Sphaerisporangium melleum]